jgi:hypothetical protein
MNHGGNSCFSFFRFLSAFGSAAMLFLLESLELFGLVECCLFIPGKKYLSVQEFLLARYLDFLVPHVQLAPNGQFDRGEGEVTLLSVCTPVRARLKGSKSCRTWFGKIPVCHVSQRI